MDWFGLDHAWTGQEEPNQTAPHYTAPPVLYAYSPSIRIQTFLLAEMGDCNITDRRSHCTPCYIGRYLFVYSQSASWDKAREDKRKRDLLSNSICSRVMGNEEVSDEVKM